MSIGLGVALVIFEGMYLRTKYKHWEQLTKFRIKIFTLIFGLGVATGIVMEYLKLTQIKRLKHCKLLFRGLAWRVELGYIEKPFNF